MTTTTPLRYFVVDAFTDRLRSLGCRQDVDGGGLHFGPPLLHDGQQFVDRRSLVLVLGQTAVDHVRDGFRNQRRVGPHRIVAIAGIQDVVGRREGTPSMQAFVQDHAQGPNVGGAVISFSPRSCSGDM